MCARCAPPLAQAHVLHFVLLDMGHIGLCWAERDPARMSRELTVHDIRSGELRNVVQVIETEITAGGQLSSRDVTDDVLAVCVRHPEPMRPSERLAALHDQRRDYHKHEVMAKFDRLIDTIKEAHDG
jgi:hypothetical protein